MSVRSVPRGFLAAVAALVAVTIPGIDPARAQAPATAPRGMAVTRSLIQLARPDVTLGGQGALGAQGRAAGTGGPFALDLSDSVADRGPMRFPPASPLAGRHVFRDGGQTVPLSDGRTLWIFSDTQIDFANALAVHNSAALSDPSDPEVVVDPMPAGKLVELIEPVHDDPAIANAPNPVPTDPDCPTTKDGVPFSTHTAWPSGGVARPNGDGTDTVLVFYLNACVYIDATDFAYEQLSMGVATLLYDPADRPDLSQPSTIPALVATVTDNTLFAAPDLFGASPVLANGQVHLYRCAGDLFGAECRAARAPLAAAATTAGYSFWNGADWTGGSSADAVPMDFGAGGVPFGGMQIVPTPARPAIGGAASDPAAYVMTYVLVPDRKLSFRTAPAPEGPWSDVMQANLGPCNTAFFTGCYAPAPQPSLSTDRELGLSFVSQVDHTMRLATIPYREADAMHTLATPSRVFDTRDGTGRAGLVAPLAGGATASIAIAGESFAGQPVPVSATAAVVNVTVVSRGGGTHIVAGPTGGPTATGSTANTPAGLTRANTTIVDLGPTGRIDVTNGPGAAEVIVDLIGWIGPSGSSHFVAAPAPARILDTRDGTGLAGPGPLGPGEVIERIAAGETLSGVPIPAGATALVVNVTAVTPLAATHLTVYPSGALPPTSTVNVEAGLTRANFAVVGLGSGGGYGVRNNSGQVHVVIDLLGWLVPIGADPAAETAFTVQSAVRAVDTRDGSGVSPGGHPGTQAKVGPGGTLTLTGAAVGGTTADARAVIVNLTGELPSAATHLTVGAAGAPLPGTSNVNLPSSETVANLVVVEPNPSGDYVVRNNSGSLNVLVDVIGWLTAT